MGNLVASDRDVCLLFGRHDQFSKSSEGATGAYEEMRRKQRSARLALKTPGNLFIELFEFHSPAPREIDRGMNDFGMTHLSFEVENVHEAFVALKAHGIEWHSDPIDAGDGYLMTYGRDPFGNVIEIQQVPEERPYAFAQLRA